MHNDVTPGVLSFNSAVDGLTLDVFELTNDGPQIQSLTGTGSFSGRSGRTSCCCVAGSSTTCISTGGGLCLC